MGSEGSGTPSDEADGVNPAGNTVAIAERDLPLRRGSVLHSIIEGYLRCRARWGIAKTTIDDVVTEAGLSRATFYRACPGGRAGLIDLATRHEVAVYLDKILTEIEPTTTLADRVTTLLHAADRIASDDEHHGLTLQQVVLADSAGLLTRLHWDPAGTVITRARAMGVEMFSRWLEPRSAADVGEWIARILIMNTFAPYPAGDLSDTDYVTDLVENRILRAVTAREAP